MILKRFPKSLNKKKLVNNNFSRSYGSDSNNKNSTVGLAFINTIDETSKETREILDVVSEMKENILKIRKTLDIPDTKKDTENILNLISGIKKDISKIQADSMLDSKDNIQINILSRLELILKNTDPKFQEELKQTLKKNEDCLRMFIVQFIENTVATKQALQELQNNKSSNKVTETVTTNSDNVVKKETIKTETEKVLYFAFSGSIMVLFIILTYYWIVGYISNDIRVIAKACVCIFWVSIILGFFI